RLHPDFPQVVDYRLGGQQLAGRLGDALTSVLVNETQQPVAVAAPVVDGSTATYAITLPGIEGASFDAVVSVADGTLRFELANLVNPGDVIQRVRIPNHDLVTVGSADAAAQITGARMGVDRNANYDDFRNVASTPAGNVQGAWLAFANTATLAAAFDTNAVEDNRGPQSTSSRVAGDNNRMQHQIRLADDDVTKYGSVWAGTWTWRSQAVQD